MRNRAFTLIELLVVIAIIALLASIAMPAFRGVQERAAGTKDAANLRQIGIGFAAYLGDHDDTIMTTTSLSGSSSYASVIGPSSTADYVSDWHVFQSPFDKRPFVTTAPENVSYGMNGNILSLTSGSNTVTSFRYPSSLMVLGPVEKASGANLIFPDTSASSTPLLPNAGVVGVMSNQTLLNVLFQDGHVGSMKATDFNNSNYAPDTNSGGSNMSMFWQPGAP